MRAHPIERIHNTYARLFGPRLYQFDLPVVVLLSVSLHMEGAPGLLEDA